MTLKAVITGDLVHSRRHTAAEVEQAMDILRLTANSLSHETECDTRFTRHRGDGWQIYLDFPGLCLTAALQLATALRGAGSPIETRQSIGIGTVATLPASGLGAARGDAFEASGPGLDHMDRRRRLVIQGRGLVTPFHEAIIALADWHLGRWSREQAQSILLVLKNPETPISELASQIGISRQALQARLSGAGFAAWEEALNAFQGHDWQTAP